jgi:DNA-binding protein
MLETEFKKKKITNNSVIFIGHKPQMNYVMAIVTELNRSDEASIMARGKAINTAVDVVEIARSKYIKGIQIDNIKIGTETAKSKNGKLTSFSTIEIHISQNSVI